MKETSSTARFIPANLKTWAAMSVSGLETATNSEQDPVKKDIMKRWLNQLRSVTSLMTIKPKEQADVIRLGNAFIVTYEKNDYLCYHAGVKIPYLMDVLTAKQLKEEEEGTAKYSYCIMDHLPKDLTVGSVFPFRSGKARVKEILLPTESEQRIFGTGSRDNHQAQQTEGTQRSTLHHTPTAV